MRNVTVRMGDMKTAKSPDTLETMGIGSCLVIILYDPVAKIGGLAHAMLPIAPPEHVNSPQRLRYVDRAIDALLLAITSGGGVRERMTAKLVGGAHMFPLYGDADHGIGARNAELAHEILAREKIEISGEEIGGSVGRNVRFDLATGICNIETRM